MQIPETNSGTSDCRKQERVHRTIANCVQITPEIGITSTPVIDRQAGPHGTIHAAAMSKDQAGNYFQRLHALDLETGVR
jgi:hypothetical protein